MRYDNRHTHTQLQVKQEEGKRRKRKMRKIILPILKRSCRGDDEWWWGSHLFAVA